MALTADYSVQSSLVEGELSGELARLRDLSDEGAITDEEFLLAKRRLLDPETRSSGKESTAAEPLASGWYSDPSDRGDAEWYWNGNEWTGKRRRRQGPGEDDYVYYEVRAPGNPVCDRCGGTEFVPRRKTSTKVAFGLMSLAGRPRHIECVRCGKMHRRG